MSGAPRPPRGARDSRCARRAAVPRASAPARPRRPQQASPPGWRAAGRAARDRCALLQSAAAAALRPAAGRRAGARRAGCCVVAAAPLRACCSAATFTTISHASLGPNAPLEAPGPQSQPLTGGPREAPAGAPPKRQTCRSLAPAGWPAHGAAGRSGRPCCCHRWCSLERRRGRALLLWQWSRRAPSPAAACRCCRRWSAAGGHTGRRRLGGSKRPSTVVWCAAAWVQGAGRAAPACSGVEQAREPVGGDWTEFRYGVQVWVWLASAFGASLAWWHFTGSTHTPSSRASASTSHPLPLASPLAVPCRRLFSTATFNNNKAVAMAKGGDKRRVEQNAAHLRKLQLAILGVNVSKAVLSAAQPPLLTPLAAPRSFKRRRQAIGGTSDRRQPPPGRRPTTAAAAPTPLARRRPSSSSASCSSAPPPASCCTLASRCPPACTR